MIYLIYGPPGSGKTSYVLEHIGPTDIMIDFDRIYAAISGKPEYTDIDNLFNRVLGVREYLETSIFDFPDVPNTWVIRGAALSEEREKWAGLGAREKLMLASKNECIRRISKDPRRRGNQREWVQAVNKWFADYANKT